MKYQQIFSVFWCTFFWNIIDVTSVPWGEPRSPCSNTTERQLGKILGPAFNSRYMSIKKPVEEVDPSGTKRDIDLTNTFYVDERYQVVIDQPATQVDHIHPMISLSEKRRSKRRHPGRNLFQDGSDGKPSWKCESRINWLDLGPDYFPRYVRNVECLQKNCWYGQYKCVPRSFAIKILRRKNGRCMIVPTEETSKGSTTIDADNTAKTGTVGLPKELREMWVWEERALSFCCDCQAN